MLDTCLFDTIPLTGNKGANKWLWHNGDTNYTIDVNTSGVYWVKNMYCNDTVTDTFEVKGYIYEFRKEYICVGDSFLFGNKWLQTPGSFIDTFQNNLSCDTIVYLNLYYLNPAPDSTFVKDTICLNDTIQVGYKILPIRNLLRHLTLPKWL